MDIFIWLRHWLSRVNSPKGGEIRTLRVQDHDPTICARDLFMSLGSQECDIDFIVLEYQIRQSML